ncbi:Gfo/Idh/MocA family oxidoreductase [bacterium]|nr:Gfo/Idh/MocA family oxidoreductase [bacterium]
MAYLKVAVIGTGNWGKNHVRIFYNLPQCVLSAICDADNDKLSFLQKSYPDINSYNDYKKMFSEENIDAVIVASSAVTHYQISKDALMAGKHVLVEKPMSLRSSESMELTKLAEEKNLKIMVGHLLEYHSAVEKLKDIILSGEIGHIFYIYSQRVNLGVVRSEENALWSLAPHDISIILYLLDEEPEFVSANGQSFLQDNIEDVVFLNLKFKSGKIAHIHLSWLDPHKIRRTTIVGDKKMVVFDDMEPVEKIKVYDKRVDVAPSFESYQGMLQLWVGDVLIPKINLKEPLKIEAAHFIDAIVNDKQPRSDGYDGIRVTKVLEAAQKSLDQKGKLVKLN